MLPVNDWVDRPLFNARGISRLLIRSQDSNKILDTSTQTTTCLAQPKSNIVASIVWLGCGRVLFGGFESFSGVDNLVVVPVEDVSGLQLGLEAKPVGEELEGIEGVELLGGELWEVG